MHLMMRMGKKTEEIYLENGEHPVNVMHHHAKVFTSEGCKVVWNRGGWGFSVLKDNNHICSVWMQ